MLELGIRARATQKERCQKVSAVFCLLAGRDPL